MFLTPSLSGKLRTMPVTDTVSRSDGSRTLRLSGVITAVGVGVGVGVGVAEAVLVPWPAGCPVMAQPASAALSATARTRARAGNLGTSTIVRSEQGIRTNERAVAMNS